MTDKLRARQLAERRVARAVECLEPHAAREILLNVLDCIPPSLKKLEEDKAADAE